jgi:hypothetical protein
MSLSDACDAHQQNDPIVVVTWNYYKALHDHFHRQLGVICDPIVEDIQNVQLMLDVKRWPGILVEHGVDEGGCDDN